MNWHENLTLLALKIFYGPKHPSVATFLDQTGQKYLGMGDFKEAEALFTRCLERLEKVYGTKHLSVAAGLNNLGEVYFRAGEFIANEADSKLSLIKAEDAFSKSLIILKELQGDRHPNVATTLNALGKVHLINREYERAEKCFKEALEIQKKVLGDRDIHYAFTLNNLGLVYNQMNATGHALVLFETSVEILEKNLGFNHPEVKSLKSKIKDLQQEKPYPTKQEDAAAHDDAETETNIPPKDEPFNHWDWMSLFISANTDSVPIEWRKDEDTQVKCFAFTVGAIKGMADVYGFKYIDAWNGYGAVLDKDIKPIQDEGAFSRMETTICQDPHMHRYMTEGSLAIKRAVLEKDTQAFGHLFSLLLEEQ